MAKLEVMVAANVKRVGLRARAVRRSSVEREKGLKERMICRWERGKNTVEF